MAGEFASICRAKSQKTIDLSTNITDILQLWHKLGPLIFPVTN